jgi:hypothetical protein
LLDTGEKNRSSSSSKDIGAARLRVLWRNLDPGTDRYLDVSILWVADAVVGVVVGTVVEAGKVTGVLS